MNSKPRLKARSKALRHGHNNKDKGENEQNSRAKTERRFKPKLARQIKQKRYVRPKFKRDRYPDEVPVQREALEKYDTGAFDFDPENARTRVGKRRFETKRERFIERIERTARAELLSNQEPGIVATDDDVPTFMVEQKSICDSIDSIGASKHFELDLQFGPYKFNYTRNGRHILIGGRRGHIAAFDWMTKDLKNETNVMESIRDVQWLHVETMYAVAQKRWVHIYDNQGVELHCMKNMFDIKRLEFLPRHMLLVASAGNTCIHYLDVSIGKIVSAFTTGRGSLNVMTQNPANATIFLGDSRGRISIWSPNSREPLVDMFVHKGAVNGVAVDTTGTYMTTIGLDRKMRIWDIRTYKELFAYTSNSLTYDEVAYSQRQFLAVSAGNIVQVFKDAHLGSASSPYMVNRCKGVVSKLEFCPFEDVLGVGHSDGFSSLIIPGCGEPNFDGLYNNPFESKKQRQEREVRMLLEKIQPEMISLDPSSINKVNRKGLKSTLEFKEKVMRIKPTDITDV